MNYQKLIIVGNATDNAEQMKSKKGVAYTTFGMGVSDFADNTTYFSIIVFGNQVEPVAKYVAKGREVLVDGRIEVNDNGAFRVVANSVQFGKEQTSIKSK